MLQYSLHAKRQLFERNLSEIDVEQVVNKPDEVLEIEGTKRQIAQKILKRDGRNFLYRVVYEERNIIITAYRTTKVDKYLRKGEQG